MPLKDLRGKKFGCLTVIERNFSKKRTAWLCQCDCGKRTVVASGELQSGGTKSCGHLLVGRKPTHNMSHTPTWNTWTTMIARCQRQKHEHYRYYGGRGIKVCERWQSFANFWADMGTRPDGMTIDRIDGNGNYEPGNCRWATRLEQQQNKPKKRYETTRGLLTAEEMAEIVGCTTTAIWVRLRNGWTKEELLVPKQWRRRKNV
jgi:hypothetical protein